MPIIDTSSGWELLLALAVATILPFLPLAAFLLVTRQRAARTFERRVATSTRIGCGGTRASRQEICRDYLPVGD